MVRNKRMRRQIDRFAKHLEHSLNIFMIEVPDDTVCGCGKPVVFPEGSRTFNCTRCGARYKLIVEVKQMREGKRISHSLDG